MGSNRRGFSNLLLITLTILAIGLGILGIRFPGNPFAGFIERLELATYDARVRWQGGIPFAGETIAVVTIDDETMARLADDPRTRAEAKWPFPNRFHAEVIQRLQSFGARAIGFDLLSFANPSRSLYQFEDQELASAASNVGNVILACKFANLGVGTLEYQQQKEKGVIWQPWIMPAAPFRNLPTGYVNVNLDPDGSVRQFLPDFKRLSLFPIKCLAGETLRQAGLPSTPVPPGLTGSSPVYFAFSDPAAIASGAVTYADLLLATMTGEIATELEAKIKGRIVLVGPTFAESHDFFFTPFSGQQGRDTKTPGVFLHAMIGNTLLKGAEIRRTSRDREQLLAGTFLFLCMVLSATLSPGASFLLLLLMIFSYLGWAIQQFTQNLIWLPIASPLLAGGGGFIPFLAVRLLVSESRRVMIKKLFSAYVSGEVLTYVQNHPDRLKLEGERRDVTVFFSDLRGFTTISEGVTPEKLSEIMNLYLTPMTEIIMSQRGYLDKYIGDAIMAVFGAPMPDPDHARHACLAAVYQRRKLDILADQIEKACGVKVFARMGVNTGIVSAGNMGSQDRFQYTVMGDVVNQASRFEGANKMFESGIMIGEPTFLAARDLLVARRLANLIVKGKTVPVRVYELLELRAEISPERLMHLERLIERFHEALDGFEAGKILEAHKAFGALLEEFPGDGPASSYRDRCAEMLKEGIPADFHGAIKLDSK